MTEFEAPGEVEFADYLIGKSAEERKQITQRFNARVMAALPDSEIGKPPVATLGEFLDREIELPPMLVEPGLVARGAITAMVARGGKGKTAVSLNRLVRWSMGRPLHDELPDVNAPVEPLRCLIIENEGSPGHFQFILNRIVTGGEFSAEEIELAKKNVHVWGDGGWSGLKLDDPENLALVDRGIAETEADIAFIEPFRGLWKGDENSSTDMANVLDAMSGLANKHNCGVIITHHERKSAPGEGGDAMDVARGSGALEGHAAVMERWRPVKGGQYRELQWIKNRFKDAPAPIRMEWDRERWGYTYVPEAVGERQVMELLQQAEGEMSATDIAEELDENYNKVLRWCKSLSEDSDSNVVSKRREGKWTFRSKMENGDSDGLSI